MNALAPSPRSAGLASAASQAEAQRQRALLTALFAPQATATPDPALGLRQQGAAWDAGLAAYRGNGLAHATNALRTQFPTVLAMLGGAAFDAVCARHWRRRPPLLGDLAWVGGEFPQTLAEQDDLQPWPWLADCARLDLALWQVLFDPPAAFGERDLRMLAEGDPALLRLRLAQGTRLLESPWPVVTLWHVHRQAQPDPEALRAAMRQPGEAAWVWREGLQTQCAELAPEEARWLRALRTRPTLGGALNAVADDFDIGAWLQTAVSHGWLDGVAAVARAVTPANSDSDAG